jgi:hypothetical protein
MISIFYILNSEAEYKQNVKNVVPLRIQKLVKSVLVKMVDNLRKTINLLPE